MSRPLPRVMADLPVSKTAADLLAGKVELVAWDSPGPVDGVYIAGHHVIDGPFLDRVGPVKVVSNCGVGVDHIDLAAAAERGVPVGNTPGVLTGATADMAFALLLAAGRRLVEGDRLARHPDTDESDIGKMMGREVHGSTLGIIGLGRIGEAVARRALGFDMTVLYHNRRPRPDVEAALGVRYTGKAELLAAADFVVLTVPLSSATRHLIGKTELEAMKPTAVLVNVARGGVVDQDALVDALRDRTIFAAGLDVTEPEPLPRDHPLLTLDNLVITPHVGSATAATRRAMAERAVENLLAGLAGTPLPSRVG